MVEDLIKLADYLEKKDKRASNIIDGFIGLTNKLLRANYGTSKPSPAIDIGGDSPFNLLSKDGAKIISLVENAFRMVDDGAADGRIEVVLIRDIVNSLYCTHSKTVTKSESCDEPLTPNQVAHILKETAKYVKSYYRPIGNFYHTEAGEYIISVYENYQDKYLDDYLKVEPSESNYKIPDQAFDNTPKPRIVGGNNPDQVNKNQDLHEMRMRRNSAVSN